MNKSDYNLTLELMLRQYQSYLINLTALDISCRVLMLIFFLFQGILALNDLTVLLAKPINRTIIYAYFVLQTLIPMLIYLAWYGGQIKLESKIKNTILGISKFSGEDIDWKSLYSMTQKSSQAKKNQNLIFKNVIEWFDEPIIWLMLSIILCFFRLVLMFKYLV